MLFNSFSFLLFFLPLSLAGFFWCAKTLGHQAAIAWLIFMSLFFYASWEPTHLWLLVASIAFNYIVAMLIMRLAGQNRLWLVVMAVIANILTLAFYKSMVSGEWGIGGEPSIAFSTERDVIIPLAISFFTFQQIAFLIDIHKKRITKVPRLEYTFFITFFPQLVMGPIVHYRELVPQIKKPDFLVWNQLNFDIGLSIFILGLFKKVVLADNIAPQVDAVYDAAYSNGSVATLDAWMAAFGFQMQLYFDFSGYTDMAIGLARMFNINLPINFDSPYRSIDRFDHWRRWHISFSTFMRQYVFFPLARFRYLRLDYKWVLMLTALLSGMWHGLGITFILWGGMQGLLMLILHIWGDIKKRLGLPHRKPILNRWLSVILTFLTTTMFAVLFRSKDLDVAATMYASMANASTLLFSGQFGELLHRQFMNRYDALLLILMFIIIWGLPNIRRFFGNYWSAPDQRSNIPTETLPDLLPGAKYLRFTPTRRWAAVLALLLLTSLIFMSGGSSRFIYYQF